MSRALVAFAAAAVVLLASMLAVDASPRHHQGHRGVPWCGIFMMQHTGIHSPGLAKASNWAGVGHATYGPAPGVIGVMAHHVFQVVAVLDHGMVMAISGNDSNAVRTRPRSTRGVFAWRVI